jgi:hypothetical protein
VSSSFVNEFATVVVSHMQCIQESGLLFRNNSPRGKLASLLLLVELKFTLIAFAGEVSSTNPISPTTQTFRGESSATNEKKILCRSGARLLSALGIFRSKPWGDLVYERTSPYSRSVLLPSPLCLDDAI